MYYWKHSRDWQSSCVVFALLYAPIFYLIFYSFNDTQTMNQFTGFTLDNYRNVFEDTRLLTIVLNTFLLAFLSALIATITINM
ncbi:hypothetical protein DRJ71_18885, partial [Enterococcus faecalis]